MPRIQGLTESGLITGPMMIKQSAKGYLFALTLTYTGATAGQKCYLRDTASNQDTGPVLVPFVAEAAQGNFHYEWTQGKEFVNGLGFDKESFVGTVELECTYK